jgi:hypothetical protein
MESKGPRYFECPYSNPHTGRQCPMKSKRKWNVQKHSKCHEDSANLVVQDPWSVTLVSAASVAGSPSTEELVESNPASPSTLPRPYQSIRWPAADLNCSVPGSSSPSSNTDARLDLKFLLETPNDPAKITPESSEHGVVYGKAISPACNIHPNKPSPPESSPANRNEELTSSCEALLAVDGSPEGEGSSHEAELWNARLETSNHQGFPSSTDLFGDNGIGAGDNSSGSEKGVSTSLLSAEEDSESNHDTTSSQSNAASDAEHDVVVTPRSQKRQLSDILPDYDTKRSKVHDQQQRAVLWMHSLGRNYFHQHLTTILARWGVTRAHKATCVSLTAAWAALNPMTLMKMFDFTKTPLKGSAGPVSQSVKMCFTSC